MIGIGELEFVVLVQIATLGNVGARVRMTLPLGVWVANGTSAQSNKPISATLSLRRRC